MERLQRKSMQAAGKKAGTFLPTASRHLIKGIGVYYRWSATMNTHLSYLHQLIFPYSLKKTRYLSLLHDDLLFVLTNPCNLRIKPLKREVKLTVLSQELLSFFLEINVLKIMSCCSSDYLLVNQHTPHLRHLSSVLWGISTTSGWLLGLSQKDFAVCSTSTTPRLI